MTHPHDVALLYDLLDGRIAPAAAEELRKRLTEEPELAAAWDELQRMREGLRALPTPPVPKNFLEGVKARAGIVDKTPAPAPSAASAAGGSAGAPPAGKVYRMRPWAYAVAAGIGIVAALAGYRLASGPDEVPVNSRIATETAKTEAKKKAEEGADYRRTVDDASAARNELAKETGPTAKDQAGERFGAGAPAGPPAPPRPATAGGRFGAPGGAIPPGLREPNDPSRPTAATPPPTQPPPPPTTPSDGPVERLDRDSRFEHRAGDRAEPTPGPTPEDTFAFVREGVDDVLVVHADSLDEGRAKVSIFYATISQTAPTSAWKAPTQPEVTRWQGAPVVRLAKEVARLDAPAAGSPPAEGERMRRTAPPPASAPSGGAPAAKSSPSGAGAVPPESQVVLGSFLLDLSPAEWTRAKARVAEAAAGEAQDGVEARKGLVGATQARGAAVPPPAAPSGPDLKLPEKADRAKPGEKPGDEEKGRENGESDKGGAAPAPKPVPAPAPGAEAAPPPPGEPNPQALGDDAGDDKAVRRKVRILVLPIPKAR